MLTDHSEMPEPARAALERVLAPLQLLEDVVRWSFSQAPPLPVLDVVVQDEFTHDVVLAWQPGRFLVFETT